jgi:AraC-like DNA-binding protein
MLDLAARFAQTLDMREPDRALWQRPLLMEALLMLRRPGEDARTTNGDPRYTDRIGQAVEFVFNSYGITTAQDAAKHCGISRSRFDTIFQKTMGLSFARFALRYRLSGAAVQLLHSDDAMKTIAAEWGFTDGSHFNRAFCAHYGCTPGAYREANSSGNTSSRMPSS